MGPANKKAPWPAKELETHSRKHSLMDLYEYLFFAAG